jgi:5'-deoxynucleotidase
VKRWQIVNVSRQQTIAEHMFNVNLIAMEIGRRMGINRAGMEYISRWALIHDIPEVVTGDIATPTKQAMRAAVPDSDPIHHVELSLDDEYKELYLTMKKDMPVELDVVKLADMIDAAVFLLDHGIGRHAEQVRLTIVHDMRKKVTDCAKKYTGANWSVVTDIYNKLVG